MQKNTKDISFDSRRFPLFALILSFSLIFSVTFFPSVLADGVRYGVRLAAVKVIPSIFPFFVVADALVSIPPSKFGSTSQRLRNLKNVAMGIFIGFPLGARLVSDSLDKDEITEKEARILLPLSTAPSFAFTVSAVGVGMLHSPTDGFVLFFSVLTSALITALILLPKSIKTNKPPFISRQSFDLVGSIKSAGASSVTASSYIIFFCSIAYLIGALLKEGWAGLLLSSAIEVSTGMCMLSVAPLLKGAIKSALCAFFLSFSGISLALEAKSAASFRAPLFQYIIVKILASILAGAMTFLIKSYIII